MGEWVRLSLSSYQVPTRDPDAGAAGENGGGSEGQEKTGGWCINASIHQGDGEKLKN